ncbi:eukaryotic translation initiation factor 3 subunit 8 [Gregarina niphandrodes]|uniref:Eukaryotic translation initiation factor 3 subunit 8 n=1 Tax=Gregarina niphandrodes TaxID=110365 RepID=A0A023B5V8_GRENI|nr:eukaryotic translation initiation factor 3 subunit 8 [Gregarina niphandrodes]EZG63417.1 eukaryotic translation initiation factor 3 subunit 8 [Gregarina niphandrodes]|eukprot:XP_011130679.1 eukaryotic translation initiation factor 3 subunit 8 [Gregarina niphandrodes]
MSSNEDSSSSAESDEDSSSSGGEDDEDLDFEAKHARALKKWGISEVATSEKKDKREKQGPKEPKRVSKTVAEKDAEREAAKKSWRDEIEHLPEEAILSLLQELTQQRVKRSSERSEQQDMLREAANVARQRQMPRLLIESLRGVVGAALEHSASMTLSAPMWRRTAEDVMELYVELCQHQDITFITNEGSPAAAIAGFVDRLQSSLFKNIRNGDSASEQLLPDLQRLLVVAHAYLVNAEAEFAITGRALESIIAHTYYMENEIAANRWRVVLEGVPAVIKKYLVLTFDGKANNTEWIKRAAHEILRMRLQDAKIGFYATCYFIQNRAINGYVEEARDVLANTPLFELAQTLDVAQQIQYNRAICQVGLAAFRQGNAALAAPFLNEICANGKHRELLAQGVAIVKGFEKSPEQEKSEKRRLLPSYLHINLDLIESAFNICSMLVEVPYLRMDLRPGAEKHTGSKSLRFRRILEYTEKSCVPPETNREIVFACARSLLVGDDEKAIELFKSLKFWATYPYREEVQTKLIQKFREIALTCYVQKYASIYSSMSANDLSELFELPASEVYAQISRMILRKELNASWDGSGDILYIQESVCTPLQSLTLNMLKPLETLFESNQQALAIRK